jgi:hypothetical protein
MQKVFNDSQDDKESRFESFLLSSGYQFLGDYELGPWQFSERNQYIRYDGQYWRLAPTAPSDFATTGVTASTFEVDKLSLVSMDSDVLRQELAGSDGLKLLGRAASASALRSIEPTEDNQRIETASYAGNLVDGQLIGGSRYEYDKSDNSSYDDGVLTFVTQSGARWKLISGTNTLPIYTTGISGNGGDEGSNLNAVIAALKADAIENNRRWVIDGCGIVINTSVTIYIDLVYVGLKNVTINYEPDSSTSGIKYAVSLNGSVESSSNNYRYVFDNIFLLGPDDNRENIHALKVAPSKTLQGFSPVSLSISQFDAGIVFGSNAYILNFVNAHIMRCITPITDTVAVGDASSISNAGENIRFSGGVIANSKKLMNFTGIEIGLVLNAISLDYFGGTLSENYPAITIARNGVAIDFNSTWIETGNVNSGLTDNFINIVGSNVSAKIAFRGGRVLLSSTTYNNAPFFINDEAGKSLITINGTYLYGLGIRQWISDNGQFDSFLPSINYDLATTYGRIGGVPRLILDHTFTDSTIPDNWQADGVQTSRLTSNLITAERVALTDGSYALKVQRTATIGGAVLRLFVPVPKNKFSPQVRFNIYTESGLTLTTPVYITMSMSSVRGTEGSYGRPVILSGRQVWQTTLSQLSAGDNSVVMQNQLVANNANTKYDHVIIAFNVDRLGISDAIYIKQVDIDKPH